MASKIIIKRGGSKVGEAMPLLSSGELGYHLKENALYIGTSMNARNVRLCGEDDVANINAQIEELRGLISDLTARLDELNK